MGKPGNGPGHSGRLWRGRENAAARAISEIWSPCSSRARGRRATRPSCGPRSTATWRSTSWRETAEQVARLSAALKRLGLAKGDRVMLVSENRPEWLISDLAIMAAGCVTVPTYITNTERDHQHIIDDSGARAVIVSTQKLAKALLPAAIRLGAASMSSRIEAPAVGQESNCPVPRLDGADRRPRARRHRRLRRRRRLQARATSPASSTRRAPAARRAA